MPVNPTQSQLAALALGLALFAVSPANARPNPAGRIVEPTTDSVRIGATTLVVLWTDGEVVARPEERRENAALPLLLGEHLGRGVVVDAALNSRAIFLAAGDELVTLAGPGRWLIETGQITALNIPPDGRIRSPLARLDRLEGYREGPLPMLEPMSSQPMLVDPSSLLILAIAHPSAPVTRSVRPEIRWHWPYEGGRFDLIIEQTDPSGTEVVALFERWRNLEGRTHQPWADLEMGATYRISLAHAATSDRSPATSPASSPIFDHRVVHVLAPSEIAAIDGATASLDRLQGNGTKFRPEIDVLRARLLESHGLWDEAEMVWTALAILYPGKDDVLHNALRLHLRSNER